jgi:putative hydrolase of the HAD superfamily
LLTNGRTKTQNTKVDLLGIRPLLDCIVISEATGYKKPAPEIFQIALNEAGSLAEETWFVEIIPSTMSKALHRLGLRASGWQAATNDPKPRQRLFTKSIRWINWSC